MTKASRKRIPARDEIRTCSGSEKYKPSKHAKGILREAIVSNVRMKVADFKYLPPCVTLIPGVSPATR